MARRLPSERPLASNREGYALTESLMGRLTLTRLVTPVCFALFSLWFSSRLLVFLKVIEFKSLFLKIYFLKSLVCIRKKSMNIFSLYTKKCSSYINVFQCVLEKCAPYIKNLFTLYRTKCKKMKM